MDQENNVIMHYGVARRSGRYPWGSGKEPYQRTADFIARLDELKSAGKTDVEIADILGMKTGELRIQRAVAQAERRATRVAQAKDLKAKGYTDREIAAKMGFANDSSVRALLNVDTEAKAKQVTATVDFLKKNVDERGMIEVGKATEYDIGVSRVQMDQALFMLQQQGYEIYKARVPQQTNPGKYTSIEVLCPPGTPYHEIYDDNFGNVHSIVDYHSDDNGQTFRKYQYPQSIKSSRVHVRYAEEGGEDRDGLIEIRRGVPDLSLGNSNYAQVRILVDGTHYLKGMAVYSDNIPEGSDIVFNTNKHLGTPKCGDKHDPKGTVLKNIDKENKDNPFGANLKEVGGQSMYVDKNGKKQLSAINKTREEGDWDEWADTLPSQFLAKQPTALVKRQLNAAYADKVQEFKEISALTQPTIKKTLMAKFAESCDSQAVDLDAASLPRQRWHVMLPDPTLKDTEIYAPNYKDGERVVLVRYPHGGTFEIPELRVNNRHRSSENMMGKNSIDAVAVNKHVADRLSGADFDGDTVMVIPVNDKIHVQTSPALKGLDGFDPKSAYPARKGMPVLAKGNQQKKMGEVSNLIMDMTIAGASSDDIAKAVRHSMVVIDAVKHNLDYKQSEIDNDIKTLKKIYQGRVEDGRYHEGAATIVTKAKSDATVKKRIGSPQIDKETGEVHWKESGETYTTKSGKEVYRMQRSTKMAEANDANELVSKYATPTEYAYADYANKLKSLANTARKDMIATRNVTYNADARKTYDKEVKGMNDELILAYKNIPRERHAQTVANSRAQARIDDDPYMDKKTKKKIRDQELRKAREEFGAKRYSIEIDDARWEAIQAGAMSETQLRNVFKYADMDSIRKRATPRSFTTITDAKANKITNMVNSGVYTTSEIAASVGLSVSAVSKYIKEGS